MQCLSASLQYKLHEGSQPASLRLFSYALSLLDHSRCSIHTCSTNTAVRTYSENESQCFWFFSALLVVEPSDTDFACFTSPRSIHSSLQKWLRSWFLCSDSRLLPGVCCFLSHFSVNKTIEENSLLCLALLAKQTSLLPSPPTLHLPWIWLHHRLHQEQQLNLLWNFIHHGQQERRGKKKSWWNSFKMRFNLAGMP